MTPLVSLLIALGATAVGPVRANTFLGTILEILRMLDLETTICQSEACNASAERILSSIDKGVDPCDDFYSFACNGWIKNHPIPPMSMQWNQFNVLIDRLDRKLRAILSEEVKDDDEGVVKLCKTAYEACMNDERNEAQGVLPLLNLLDELEGWSVVSPAFSFFTRRAKPNWQKVAVIVTKKIGLTPLLDIEVDVDLRNTTRNAVIVEQPPVDIPSYLFNDTSFVQAYTSYFTKVVLTLRKSKKLPVHVLGLHHYIKEVVRFEMQLMLLTKNREEMRDLEKFHNPVTIQQLQEWTDSRKLFRESARINWKEYIRSLLDKDDSQVTNQTQVVVSDWEFLNSFFSLIDSTAPEVITDYLLWKVVMLLIRMTTEQMRTVNFEYKKEAYGLTEDLPRWQECVRETNEMAFAIGYMYVKKYFSDEAKAKAIAMVENIRQEFRQQLSEVTWIDEETKRAALEKADFMNHFIGYPDWYNNRTALDEYYKGLKIGKDHFDNVLAIRGFLARKYLTQLDKNPRRDEWAAGPANVNAYYDPRMNSIIFPAAILEAPFFDKDLPEAINYGSIGSIIGHEITHAFDDVGRQADKFGNIHQWWTKETEATYLENAQCFVDEYGKYKLPVLERITEGEVKLNGLLTLGENIADNGGLATSLRAYRKHVKSNHVRLPKLENYTPDQLFYIAFAMTWCETATAASIITEVMDDTHSPHAARVLGSLSNTQHFSDTWGCRRGSRMNPEKKCSLW